MLGNCTTSLLEYVNSPRLTLVWRIDADHFLEIGGDGLTADGRIRYAYRLSRHGQTVFEGHDFCSGNGAAPVAATLGHAAGCLLGFLTMRPGDVDPTTSTNTRPSSASGETRSQRNSRPMRKTVAVATAVATMTRPYGSTADVADRKEATR